MKKVTTHYVLQDQRNAAGFAYLAVACGTAVRAIGLHASRCDVTRNKKKVTCKRCLKAIKNKNFQDKRDPDTINVTIDAGTLKWAYGKVLQDQHGTCEYAASVRRALAKPYGIKDPEDSDSGNKTMIASMPRVAKAIDDGSRILTFSDIALLIKISKAPGHTVAASSLSREEATRAQELDGHITKVAGGTSGRKLYFSLNSKLAEKLAD